MTDGVAFQIVHFNPATGAIRGVGSSYVFYEMKGFTLGEIDGRLAGTIQPDNCLVDLGSIVERPGLPPLVRVIDKTPEQAAADLDALKRKLLNG